MRFWMLALGLLGCRSVTTEADLLDHMARLGCKHQRGCAGGDGWNGLETLDTCVDRTVEEFRVVLDTPYAESSIAGLRYPCFYTFHPDRIDRCLDALDTHYSGACGEVSSLDSPFDVCRDPGWDAPWYLLCEPL